jgi:hypothetical protein
MFTILWDKEVGAEAKPQFAHLVCTVRHTLPVSTITVTLYKS